MSLAPRIVTMDMSTSLASESYVIEVRAHLVHDLLNRGKKCPKNLRAVLKSACQAGLNDTKTSSLTHRVIIPLVKP